MPGRHPRRSARCAAISKLATKIQKPKPKQKPKQKQKPARKESDAERRIDAKKKPIRSKPSPLRGVGKRSERLQSLSDADATVSNKQLDSERVDRTDQPSTSAASRSPNEKSSSSSRTTKQRAGKVDRRSIGVTKSNESVSIQPKSPSKSAPSLNRRILPKAVKSSLPSSSQARGAKYYRIKKPVDVVKDSSTNTTETWIVAEPAERAPFDVAFEDKPADEDFSEDARRIIANLFDFFKRLGFADPWKETLDATRLSPKQFLRIKAELTQISHDHRY